MDLVAAASEIQRFESGGLTSRISQLESAFQRATTGELKSRLEAVGVHDSTLAASILLKQVAGQVNVLVHALGILLCLPDLLEPDETVQYVSLGAGNTGRPFDLETDRRVAEFKFMNWRGADTIRQNGLFKDLYLLEAAETPKRKQMFVVGDTLPLKFLHGSRALASVMSRNRKLGDTFTARFGTQFATVADYYVAHGHAVELVDLNRLFPGRFAVLDATVEADSAVSL